MQYDLMVVQSGVMHGVKYHAVICRTDGLMRKTAKFTQYNAAYAAGDKLREHWKAEEARKAESARKVEAAKKAAAAKKAEDARKAAKRRAR